MASSHPRGTSVASSSSHSPFVPSPQWLSESPGGPPSTRDSPPRTPYIDRPGAPSAPTPQPDPRQALRSPVPPPPANLYRDQPNAFSVDPGMPFLATAVPINDGSSSSSSAGRSVRADEDWPPLRERKFGGSFVSGLKRAVGSLSRGSRASRQRTGGGAADDHDDESYVYTQPPQFRDSGYAQSTPQLVGPQGQAPLPAPAAPVYGNQPALPPSLPNGAVLPTHVAPSQVLLPPQFQPPPPPRPPPQFWSQPQSQPQPRATYSPVTPPHPPPPPLHIHTPPTPLFSPISADPDYGSDYAQMDPPTPPPSDTPLTTYLSRAQRLLAHIAALPWVAPERVTVDYYPERAKRSAEPKHAPQIGWAAQDYARPSFRAGVVADMDAESEAGTWDTWAEEYDKAYDRGEGAGGGGGRAHAVVAPLITPRRGGNIDLGEEFEEARNTPLPTPVGTPHYGGGASLFGGFTPASRMPTPSLYARPMTPATAGAGAMTPGGPVIPPLPQDPPVIPPLPQDPPVFAQRAPSVQRTPLLANDTLPTPAGNFYGYRPSAPNSVVGDANNQNTNNNPAAMRSRPTSRASSMYTYTQPQGQGVAGSAGGGSQASSTRSRRSTTSARLTVPGSGHEPPMGPAPGTPSMRQRSRGASMSSSAYAYEGEGTRGPVWDSGYAESFREGDAGPSAGVGTSASARGDGAYAYGKYVPPPPPPLPIVGIPVVGSVGGGGGSVRSAMSGRSGRTGSSMYV